MPSTSKKQHNFMEMIAHGGKPRKGKGPSKAVAEEFVQADKGKKFDGTGQSPAPNYGGAARGAYDGCAPTAKGGCTCGQMGK